MVPYTQLTFDITILKRTFFFIVTCFIIITWIQITNILDISDHISIKEVIENASRDSQYSEVCRRVNSLREKVKDLKYILIWNPDYAPLYYFETGQWSFIRNNCSVTNCYVTSDREFFGGDITKFDAIAFNGLAILANDTDLPKHRSLHQKYIFFNMESSANYPVCSDRFENFFNWTATYKLDSDIPYPYILVRNRAGGIVGPKSNIQWGELPVIGDLSRLKNKTKAAAWFVSHCSARSKRDDYVKNLTKALSPYGYTVDVYGYCSPLKCPLDKQLECDGLLERDYYFYMALENSFADDYVTEKILTALHHDTVPVVYGGANYSRFLPPGSYLDARKFTVTELASTMHNLIQSPELYREYFRWKHEYVFSDPKAAENLCAVCEALNDKGKIGTDSGYREFRKWWYPNFAERC